MAKKNALQEAIAEAKQLRQAAIANATKQLEENLTPSIKAMLAEKLQKEFEDEEVLEEGKGDCGFKPVKQEVKEAEEPEEDVKEKDDTEEPEAEEPAKGDEEAEEEKLADDEEVDPEGEETEAPEESDEEPENPEEEAEEELPDDTPLKDITIGDLKSIISQQIAAEVPATTDPAELDPEVGDVEGQGDEVPVGDPAATTDADAAALDAPEDGEEVAPEDPELVNTDAEELPQEKGEEDDEEIDINEILKELESEDIRGKVHDKPVGDGKCQDGEIRDKKDITNEGKECPACGQNPCVCKEKEEKKEGVKKVTKESCNENKAPKTYKERYETSLGVIKVLKETLAEANLLNGKLVYANRTLKRTNLTENQKAFILDKIDRVKTIQEAKEIYRTNVKKFEARNGKENLVESHNRQFASKSAGQSTRGSEVIENEFVKRMQELAGIIE